MAALDKIDVDEVDFAAGCLRGLASRAGELGLDAEFSARVLDALEHVRAAARMVERMQRPKKRRRRR